MAAIVVAEYLVPTWSLSISSSGHADIDYDTVVPCCRLIVADIFMVRVEIVFREVRSCSIRVCRERLDDHGWGLVKRAINCLFHLELDDIRRSVELRR